MSEEMRCPACGKPNPGYLVCPHCGADARHRIGVKWVLAICLVVAVIGGIFFSLHLATLQPAPIPISAIDPWLDYSHLLVEGDVVSGPQYQSTSASFEIWDNSSPEYGLSKIRVEIYDPVFSVLMAEGKIPRVGERVRVFGQVRSAVGVDRELRVSGPDDLQIIPREPMSSTISEILSSPESFLYKRVRVEGTIAGVDPKPSAKIYTLLDNGKEIQVYIHNGLESYVEKRAPPFSVMDRVRITAGVSQYHGAPQLAVARYEEIEVVGREKVENFELGQLNENMATQFVRVRGRIIFVEGVSEANSLRLSKRVLWLENEDAPRVVLDEPVYALLENRALITRGSSIDFIGRVVKYSADKAGVRIQFVGPQALEVSPGSFEPPEVENFLMLSAADRDRVVSVEGVVKDNFEMKRRGLPSDRLLEIEDNYGGRVVIYVSNFIWERLLQPPVRGDRVRAVGVVTTRIPGKVAVQPGLPEDILVVG